MIFVHLQKHKREGQCYKLREEIKQLSNIRLTSVSFFYQVEGTLVHIIRAYTALCLGGTPSEKTGTSPPSFLLLDNCLYIAKVQILMYSDYYCFKEIFGKFALVAIFGLMLQPNG